MRTRRFFSLYFLLFFLLLAFTPPPVIGADSTGFNPTTVAVEAKSAGGGVPVGTIVAWPVASNPEDMDNWLECNGQAVSQAVYPELFALVGARVPDYRGLFLRGHGSQTHSKNNGSTVGVTSTTHSSGALNQIQGDGTRNITGDIGWTKNGGNGAIEYVSSQPEFDLRNGSGWYLARLNTSRVVPTANENRPVNMAVRYLIRALP